MICSSHENETSINKDQFNKKHFTTYSSKFVHKTLNIQYFVIILSAFCAD